MTLETQISQPCPVCHLQPTEERKDYPIKDHQVLPGFPRKICFCPSCELGFVEKPISQTLLDQIYKGDVSSWGDLKKLKGPRDFPLHFALAQARCRFIKQAMPSKFSRNWRILDIGAGNGAFGFSALEEFPSADAEYVAVDLDQNILEALKSYWPESSGAKLTTTPGIDGLSGGFDLIVLSHVLEHVVDPVEFLKSMTSLLRRDGYLFIEVPNRDDRFKKDVFPHLLFFNSKSLENTLREAGFNLVGSQVVGNLVSHSKFENYLERAILKARYALPRPILFNTLSRIYRAKHLNAEGPWLRALARR